MDLIVQTKSKKEEKVVQAFLDSLDISYFTETQEEMALHKAMEEGKKSRRLTLKEQREFIQALRAAR